MNDIVNLQADIIALKGMLNSLLARVENIENELVAARTLGREIPGIRARFLSREERRQDAIDRANAAFDRIDAAFKEFNATMAAISALRAKEPKD